MTQNKSDKCTNCGTELLHDENFCPNCGQKNTDLNISFIDVLKDFGGDYFSFDSKLFTTIWPLISKPGLVPKEYIDGKRVGHIPPLRVFIFLSFITFFLWGLSFQRVNREDQTDDSLIASTLMDSLKSEHSILDSINNENLLNLSVGEDSTSDAESRASLEYIFDKNNDPKAVIDSIAGDQNKIFKHFLIQVLRMYHAERGSVTKYFLGNISIVLLLLQPFFALLLKLFYFRNKSFFYIEHLVFSLYFHAFILFVSLLLFFISLYDVTPIILLFLLLVSLIYFLLAIKRFYEQSWRKSILKSIVISFLYLAFMLPSFMAIYFLLSLYLY